MNACPILLTIKLAAQFNNVPADVLVSIAMHESRLRPHVRGDGGKSYGLFQININLHRLRCRSITCQSFFGAQLLRHFVDRSRNMRQAVQRWNWRSRGYARRVLARRRKAKNLLQRCRETLKVASYQSGQLRSGSLGLDIHHLPAP